MKLTREFPIEIEGIEKQLWKDIKAHYEKLAEQLETPTAGLREEAVEKLKNNIRHWQAALAGGHITWACFLARKPGEH